MADESYTEADLAEWKATITAIGPEGVSSGPSSDTYEAIANLCSGWGIYFNVPTPIAELVEHALQVGYEQALEHVRQGEIRGLGEVDE
ncbi:hypothetical protein [Nonomuraea typhae]|uniref:Uncharacterized protein n=1 Tax=Nonomuraea typhae TaxID=2603600 RepID=A0ABW7YM18_9ACTN